MLTANLATRPFYNERLVRAVIVAAVAAAAAWTAVNVVTLYSLSQRGAMFRGVIDSETARATAARSEARALRGALDGAAVAAMTRAATEANQLIAHRGFSWTRLFDQFEATLPSDVRLVHVQPQVDDSGRMLVSMTVVSRTIEDLDAFIQRLEQDGGFASVLSRQDEVLDDDTIQSSLQGYYAEAANPSPASSQPPQVPAAPSAGAPEVTR